MSGCEWDLIVASNRTINTVIRVGQEIYNIHSARLQHATAALLFTDRTSIKEKDYCETILYEICIVLFI